MKTHKKHFSTLTMMHLGEARKSAILVDKAVAKEIEKVSKMIEKIMKKKD